MSTNLGCGNFSKNITQPFYIGTETTSSSLLWAILCLLHYPEVQKRVHEEIDEVVDQNRRVSLEDKSKLPYTNAVLMESMRMGTIVPQALPHRALEDIEVKGYIIPKVFQPFGEMSDESHFAFHSGIEM